MEFKNFSFPQVYVCPGVCLCRTSKLSNQPAARSASGSF